MKKFFLCMIVSLMMIFAVSIPAYAVYTPIKGGTFTFKHYLVLNENAYVPPITFSCSIVPGTPSGTVYAGPAGAIITNVTYDYTSVTYTVLEPGDDVILDEDEKYAKGTITVDLRNVTFSAPGIYRYLISGTKTGASDGVTTSPDLFLDVYISHDDATDTLKVTSTFLHLTTTNEKVAAVSDKYISNDLRVLNYVTGNQGDRSKPFIYTLRIDGGSANKKYLLRVVGEGPAGRMISSQESVTFTLKHNERARIHGLSANDKYTVTQENYFADGYTTDYSINNSSKVKELSTGEKTMGDVTNSVVYTNHKSSEEPATGIILKKLPYILMIVLVAGFGSVLLLRKHANAKMNNK